MNSIFSQAHQCLMQKNPATKCELVIQLKSHIDHHDLDLTSTQSIEKIITPGRPEIPILVKPRHVPRRSLATEQGRAALIHAITHIEFNAINLALDAVYRFQNLPEEYYQNWIQVAFEEAQHFSMLQDRLNQLGYVYGDFDAHNGLWEMAVKTDDDIVARMALVPRVLEARGLDVTPAMIDKLQNHGDRATADILKIIFEQEIGHVAIGTRWFNYVCEKNGLKPEKTFIKLLAEFMGGELRGPFQINVRRQAGFSEKELETIQNI